MYKFLDKAYEISPDFIQNCFVSIFDFFQYKKRHGGVYKYWKTYYQQNDSLPLAELIKEQNRRLIDFIRFVVAKSSFYNKLYAGIDIFSEIKTVEDLTKLPIIDKETIRKNIKNISTIKKWRAYVAHTGGTTGKSLEVFFSWEDMQERFAILDTFREKYGYKFGQKTAWFSGKNILNATNVKKNRYWKTDFLFNIRYYSTFHINPQSIPYYIENLNKYKPAIISGFPSSIYEIAKYGELKNMSLDYKPKVIYTTAETLIPKQTEIIKMFFGCNLFDFYSSSEGSPFVFQCEKGNMHYNLLSGVIEIVDANLNPSKKGEALVTSFTTKGTPLIRYRIGDTMKISGRICSCGNNYPIIDKIEGRVIDYIYSNETGPINLGNISNCVKYVNGIVKFQVVQDKIDEINVKIVKVSDEYSLKDEAMFLQELKNRLGQKMKINFEYQNDIPNEKSGKYKIIKNNIKM